MQHHQPELSWTNNDARSKVESAHGYLVVMYGLLAALVVLIVAFSRWDFNPNLKAQLITLLGLAILIAAHIKTRTGLDDGKQWATVASAILMFLPLFAFPIGTLIAGFAYFNLLRMPARKDVNEA